MSKQLFELQQNIKYLREQIKDLLHLSYLNHQSLACLYKNQENQLQAQQQSCQTIKKQQTTFIQTNLMPKDKFSSILQIFQQRCQNHLNYLITKQIQQQQQSVRRDRLIQYEDRIYDNRRLISDKQTFLENLLKPKKKRPENISAEQFQQIRQQQRIDEEKAKFNCFQKEIKNIQVLLKKFNHNNKQNKQQSQVQNSVNKSKSNDLQKTKANSLQSVNLTNNLTIDKQQKSQQSQIDNDKSQSKETQKSQSKDSNQQEIRSVISKIKNEFLNQTDILPQKAKYIEQVVKRIVSLKQSNHKKYQLEKQQKNQNKHLTQLIKSMKKNYKSIIHYQ